MHASLLPTTCANMPTTCRQHAPRPIKYNFKIHTWYVWMDADPGACWPSGWVATATTVPIQVVWNTAVGSTQPESADIYRKSMMSSAETVPFGGREHSRVAPRSFRVRMAKAPDRYLTVQSPDSGFFTVRMAGSPESEWQKPYPRVVVIEWPCSFSHEPFNAFRVVDGCRSWLPRLPLPLLPLSARAGSNAAITPPASASTCAFRTQGLGFCV